MAMIEYKKLTMVEPPSERDLNMLGAEDWDLCGMMGNNFYFKKAKTEKPKAEAPKKDAAKNRR